jgi:hypothetical protein
MNLANHIAAAIPAALNSRVCSREDCEHQGRPQPVTSFYRTKSSCRDCSNRLSNLAHERRRALLAESECPVDHEIAGNLPIGPWREWVARQIDRAGGYNGGGLKIVAYEIGITERSIGRWLHDAKYVRLDIVDKALCNCGTPWVLRELYPDLFDLPDLDEEAA